MRRSRARRGAATVELAVTMIAMLPLILYTIFLSDLLLYNLDWQEAIVTPAWDAAVLDYPGLNRPVEGASQVQGNNRLLFCDHSSAYDSFNRNYDCDDSNHHQAMGAHQCWLGGGKQVTCTINPEAGNIEDSYLQKFNRGGLLSCTSRLGVQNYFIVQRALNFGKDLTRTKKFSGDVHGNSSQANTGNSWVFGAQSGGSGSSEGEGAPGQATEDTAEMPADSLPSDDHFALLMDPWALNHPPSILPDQGARPGHQFYDRVEFYYYSGSVSVSVTPRSAAERANGFAQKLQAAKLLGASANAEQAPTGRGDLALVPNLAFQAFISKSLDQRGGRRYLSLSRCSSQYCRYMTPPGPGAPWQIGDFPPDIIPSDPGDGEIPGGPGPNNGSQVGSSTHSTSGNTPSQGASNATPTGGPSGNITPPPGRWD